MDLLTYLGHEIPCRVRSRCHPVCSYIDIRKSSDVFSADDLLVSTTYITIKCAVRGIPTYPVISTVFWLWSSDMITGSLRAGNRDSVTTVNRLEMLFDE